MAVSRVFTAAGREFDTEAEAKKHDQLVSAKEKLNPPAIIRPEAWGELVQEWEKAGLKGTGRIHRTPNRAGLFHMRLVDDFWRGNWREAVQRAGRCKQLREGNKGWPGLMIDTFLRDPDMLVRILEGQFDDREPSAPVETPAQWMARMAREER